jgi:hypothetical protein
MAKGLNRGNREVKKPLTGTATTVTQLQGKLTPPKTPGKVMPLGGYDGSCFPESMDLYALK